MIEETSGGGKFRIQSVFRPHSNVKPDFSNSFALKSVLEKFCSRDGLVSGLGLSEPRQKW